MKMFNPGELRMAQFYLHIGTTNTHFGEVATEHLAYFGE